MFVTFEGPEGAGKSTALEFVAQALEAEGRVVRRTREPGSGEFGQRIRAILLHGDPMPARSELFLFLADRANHVDSIIQPALTAGEVVLCDRYADSSYVYQALSRGLDREFVKAANDFAVGGLWPTLTLLFDLEPSIGLARISTKDRLDGEPIEFHQRVREGFVDLAWSQPERWQIIDASADADTVAQKALQAVRDRL